MRMNVGIAVAMLIALMLTIVLPAGGVLSEKSLFKELGLPEFPGAKLVTEINLEGKQLGSLAEEFCPFLGLSDMKQVSILTYSISSAVNAQEVFKFYEPSLAKPDWKTIIRSFDGDNALAILFNEKMGLFVMRVDPPKEKDREMTMMRITGRIDPSKIAGPNPPDFPWRMRPAWSASKIPVGQAISVPPSEKLYLRATGSMVKARILDQNTAEIRLASQSDDAGKLVRTGELLSLELTPRVIVDEIILPGAVPVVLEITDGSLALKGGSGPQDKVARLSVIATSAPTTIESFPLVSGAHSVKVVGDKVSVALSQVQGGSFEVEVTGGDLALLLPKDASAKLDVSAPSGKIENLTGIAPQESAADHLKLQVGEGKATITLKAINGTVCIKMAN